MDLVVGALIGIALLFLGRELYWLFVGGIGFALGTSLVAAVFGDQPSWLLVLVGLSAGLGGALMALTLQKLAVGIAGFAAGGYVLASLASALAGEPEWVAWLSFLVGGIAGAILVKVLFEWALIVLSSLSGAILVVRLLPLRPVLAPLLFVVLAGLGIVFQMRRRRRKRRASV